MHVPIVTIFILVCTWAVHLGIDISPWNFPAAMVAMMGLLLILLVLDGLSLLFPGSTEEADQNQDIEKGSMDSDQPSRAEIKQAERRRFVDPIMKIIGPPCDFLLRNMTVLFTTSFVSLPIGADTLPAKEFGLIVGWFFATLIIALLFPVAFGVLTGWIGRTVMGAFRKQKTDDVETAHHDVDRQSQETLRNPATAATRSDEVRSPGYQAQYRGNMIEQARQQGQFAKSPNGLPSPVWGAPYTGRPSMSFSPRRATPIRIIDNTNNPPMTPPVFCPPTPMTAKEDADISAALEPSAIERLSKILAGLIAPAFYLTIFLIGLPLFFVLDFSLPLFLSIAVLSFLFAIHAVPAPARAIMHPILTGSVMTLLLLWGFGLAKGHDIYTTVQMFNRGDARYTDWLSLKGYHGPVPGAGDIFASILDAGMVALAIPMYRYRYDLRDNFVRMILVLLPSAGLSLFAFPALGHMMGLSQVHALAFAGRFMSSPLAVQLSSALDANEALVTLLVVFTGVIVSIIKDPMFKLLRVPESDVVTWGLVVGSTAGAIGTASLVNRPRAMAISSLALVLFGLIMLLAASFDPVVLLIHRLTGKAIIDLGATVGLATVPSA